ncbi:DUF6095 family protein [Aureivirga marina]|uniref:DUF6095 family protein n=1 Tax=Aureivirga marina TaxID=1182451 RepID=UPI0018CBD247|nr:DUF6095 family protein [Aureivirga marina]
MSTDKTKLARGIKYEAGALPLILLAPFLINIGFKAIKRNDNYLFLIVGIIVAIIAVVLGVIGIRIILSALFDKNEESK